MQTSTFWGDLENHITKQGAGQRTRLSIFNGPIFTAHDKPWMDAFAPSPISRS